MSVERIERFTAAKPPVDAASYRDAMALLGAAVNIVTSDGPRGRVGMVATAVCSLSDAPPSLIVCINQGASSHARLIQNGAVCVNVLADNHLELAHRFVSGRTMEERFAGQNWHTQTTGSPALEGALAWFDARVEKTVEHGTHSVLICNVISLETNEQCRSGLMYSRRRYHSLG